MLHEKEGFRCQCSGVSQAVGLKNGQLIEKETPA
jgi:hypothetical protein